MLLTVLFLGLYVGFLVGICFASSEIKKLQEPWTKDDKKQIDYWFDRYMKLLKDYNQLQVMYFKARFNLDDK